MAIPDFQSLMLPLLQFAGKNHYEISNNDAIESLAQELNLTEEEVKEMLPSGIQSTFMNRIGWASTYLKKAVLLETTRRGYYKITARGQQLLNQNPKNINIKILSQYPEFNEFRQAKGNRNAEKLIEVKEMSFVTATPLEALEAAYENMRSELAEQLLSKLKTVSPSFFERIVVGLL